MSLRVLGEKSSRGSHFSRLDTYRTWHKGAAIRRSQSFSQDMMAIATADMRPPSDEVAERGTNKRTIDSGGDEIAVEEALPDDYRYETQGSALFIGDALDRIPKVECCIDEKRYDCRA